MGIAGSLDDDHVLLGDVVVSRSVCNYLGEAKAIDIATSDQQEILDFQNSMSRHTYLANNDLLKFFDGEKRFKLWRERCGDAREKLGLKVSRDGNPESGVAGQTVWTHARSGRK
jgi:nucleoside phosphorylase